MGELGCGVKLAGDASALAGGRWSVLSGGVAVNEGVDRLVQKHNATLLLAQFGLEQVEAQVRFRKNKDGDALLLLLSHK